MNFGNNPIFELLVYDFKKKKKKISIAGVGKVDAKRNLENKRLSIFP